MMRILIQRVKFARIDIEEQTVAKISQGLLVFCGFSPNDTKETLQKMLDKVLAYRIFEDSAGKMNLNLATIQGGLLLVPQFTLMADTHHGLRPGFSRGAPKELGIALFEQLKLLAKTRHPEIGFGVFGADMQITLCNDGPVTFWLTFDEDSTKKLV